MFDVPCSGMFHLPRFIDDREKFGVGAKRSDDLETEEFRETSDRSGTATKRDFFRARREPALSMQ